MSAPTLREALTEIRDRIKGHPAYADLTEAEEESIGGDTAELSYLARVADAAQTLIRDAITAQATTHQPNEPRT